MRFMDVIGNYNIEINTEEIYKKHSADNLNKFDFEYLEEDTYISMLVSVKIFENEELIKSAILGSEGGKTGISKNSKIIEDDEIIICCGNKIFCLSIPELLLKWRIKADSITCFEIFKKEDFFIVHGELEITRLNEFGKIVWKQSGADIFITYHGENDFELNEKYIIAKDWENRIYKFDYDGNVFTDLSQFS